ncbi:MAG: Hsp20 family protein, partial [Sphingomonadales bacterium]
MRSFDFTPLLQSAIGFDDLFRFASTAQFDQAEQGYPPYNIEKIGEDDYQITMALAGFSEDDIEMTLEGELLKVEGKAEPTKDEGVREFFFKGIAKRAFTRQFQLA